MGKQEWAYFKTIIDYYVKFTDPNLRIYKECEYDDDVINNE